MKIKFFASLKDHFGDEIETNPDSFTTVNDLFIHLAKIQPDAVDLLKKCRFAVNLSFVGNESSLVDISEVLVMPPSSGG